MRVAWYWVRIIGAVTIFTALAATFYAVLQAGDLEFWNFFGFFTIQSNIIAMLVLFMSALYTDRPRWDWLRYARAASTTYLVIVVAVYWTLLVNVDVQTPQVWTNTILHGVSGAIMLADWMLEGPRKPLSWRQSWTVLIYPAVWLTVILIRGATDGWVPYPFLDPANGYASVFAVAAGIVLLGWVVGLGMFQLTRWRPITPDDNHVAAHEAAPATLKDDDPDDDPALEPDPV
ncbi:Pr6Pr family membrane protein [Demequina zhanjiangensis]|uniref:Pr6Pr family membrane protein n=1 Tax=Demequina zhanjiangensis TaxID=3051659 RepID=A0ABT8FZ11_9MICO|nr:Pr6Pr family membrane protein [Demequina sp. SYSU T00b26]MDN4472140.1 Pr6Pr family membrane protein [Demequina sp. SYSU T00b26]